MQRTLTIELRFNYADDEKNPLMHVAAQQAARHLLAAAGMLSDGVKPQIAVWSDDYFSGHEEIKVLENTIQSGIDETNQDDEQVSDELLAAMRSI